MVMHQAPTHYCETYGFDAEWRLARLRLLGLSSADHVLGERLRNDIIEPNATALVDQFYAALVEDAEAARILQAANIDALKFKQTHYVLNFGVDFTEEAYFEERLRIGLVHAWVGVPLALYLCAYQVLQAAMYQFIERSGLPEQRQRSLCYFVSKIAALDSALASEIYHIAQLRHLESSVNRLRRERTQLRIEADTDALTGIANRANLLPRLAQELAHAVRDEQPLCVIMADLDHFKSINDSHGHQIGDQVLRDTAARMRAALRDFDLVGRYGGEEFIAVLRQADLETARQIAERVRQRIGGSPFQFVDLSLRITVSQGVALARTGDSVESLIARADAALYQAKQQGRNCVKLE